MIATIITLIILLYANGGVIYSLQTSNIPMNPVTYVSSWCGFMWANIRSAWYVILFGLSGKEAREEMIEAGKEEDK